MLLLVVSIVSINLIAPMKLGCRTLLLLTQYRRRSEAC